MPFDLTIREVKKDVEPLKIKREISEYLPELEKGALVTLISSVRSGKSTYITNWLLSSQFLRDAFDDVYIFSSTIKTDPTMKALYESFKPTCFDNYSETALQKIMDYQASFSVEERPVICIICDDLVNVKPTSLFMQIGCNFRHMGCALYLFSVQRMKQVGPQIRANTTNLIVGNQTQQELEMIADEFSGPFGDKQNFLKLMRRGVQNRFDKVHFRLDKMPCEVFRNLTEHMYTGD